MTPEETLELDIALWRGYDQGLPLNPRAVFGAASRLATAYVADIAAREAEAKERRLPIDAEWLESLGFRQDALDQWSNRYVALQWHPGDTWTLTIRGGSSMAYIGAVVSNCGQVLDLMSGLGIKTTAEISAGR